MDDNLQCEAWRRVRDSRDPWRKVPGLLPDEKMTLFEELMRRECVADMVEWEYAILPVGLGPPTEQRLSERRGPLSQTYRTRSLHAR